jgi:hypothetical protein
VLAQSSFFTTIEGGPQIERVDSFPFPLADPIPALNDVTAVLRAQIQGQNIIETDVIVISTGPPSTEPDGGGGIVNIPFVVKNANASQMDAIFWIEKITRPDYDQRNAEFLQLQYVQRVILDFDGIHWPHVSVATRSRRGKGAPSAGPNMHQLAPWPDPVTAPECWVRTSRSAACLGDHHVDLSDDGIWAGCRRLGGQPDSCGSLVQTTVKAATPTAPPSSCSALRVGCRPRSVPDDRGHVIMGCNTG